MEKNQTETGDGKDISKIKDIKIMRKREQDGETTSMKGRRGRVSSAATSMMGEDREVQTRRAIPL